MINFTVRLIIGSVFSTKAVHAGRLAEIVGNGSTSRSFLGITGKTTSLQLTARMAHCPTVRLKASGWLRILLKRLASSVREVRTVGPTIPFCSSSLRVQAVSPSR